MLYYVKLIKTKIWWGPTRYKHTRTELQLPQKPSNVRHQIIITDKLNYSLNHLKRLFCFFTVTAVGLADVLQFHFSSAATRVIVTGDRVIDLNKQSLFENHTTLLVDLIARDRKLVHPTESGVAALAVYVTYVVRTGRHDAVVDLTVADVDSTVEEICAASWSDKTRWAQFFVGC